MGDAWPGRLVVGLTKASIVLVLFVSHRWAACIQKISHQGRVLHIAIVRSDWISLVVGCWRFLRALLLREDDRDGD